MKHLKTYESLLEFNQPDQNIISDDEIIRRGKLEDKEAFGLLYKKYRPILLTICKRYCRNIDDAEDVLHDGFIKIFSKINTFKNDGGSFEGWMKHIMRNTALTFIKEDPKKNQINDIESVEYLLPIDGEDVKYGGNISRSKLLELIGKLPKGYQKIFTMYVFGGYSHKEISKELDISTNTSKSQLSKAKRFLRKILDEEHNIKVDTKGKTVRTPKVNT